MITGRSKIFQVGGSLAADAPSYVERSADEEIFTALMGGELCYVFNSRQMGKSSLQVRTRHRLEAHGARCAFCDLTRIGTAMIQPQQWYAGFAVELCRGFRVQPDEGFATWWRDREHLPPVSRLVELLETVILPGISEDRAYIFLDEIENALSLSFPADDFFAWIRSCVNRKAVDPRYSRLTFALFGVVTPGDLIRETTQTSFNIGRAVDLVGIRHEEAEPLAIGLTGLGLPEGELLHAILEWTAGQPFLTQKLCRLVTQSSAQAAEETPRQRVDRVVEAELLARWEFQDEPEHLRTIRDRILAQPELSSLMLSIIRDVLSGIEVSFDGSREHVELQLSGLMVRNGSRLEVRNRLYRRVFCEAWVDDHLAELRPYAESFMAWVASHERDESRLLVGVALQEARNWSRGRSLSDEDHRYLRASEEVGRLLEQQEADAARARETEARLSEREGFVRLQRLLIGAMSIALVIAVSLGAFSFNLYRRAVSNEDRAAERAEEAKQVSDFLVDVFGAADPFQARGDPLTAPELLEKGARRIQDELGNQPLLQARLMATIGRTYDKLGLYDEGAVQLEGALEIRERELGPEHGDVAISLTSLAGLYLHQGREAEALLRRAATIQEKVLGANDPDLATTLNNLGVLLAQRGSFEEAETHFRRVAAMRVDAFGPEHAEVAKALQNLAGVLAQTGRLDEAERFHQRGLAITEKLLGPDHPDVAFDLELSAFYLERREGHDEALELLHRAYEMNVDHFGPKHPRVAQVLARIGINYLDRGLWEEAELYLRRALEQREELLDPNNVSMAYSLSAMGRVCAIKGEYVEAAEFYKRAQTVAEDQLEPTNTLALRIADEYSKVLRELGH